MAKLTYTGAQLDAAIRKVRTNFADVSGVNLLATEAKIGKKFIDASKQEVTGTMPDAVITPNIAVSGDKLSNTESDYPIVIIPKATVGMAGYVSSVEDSAAVTKYINVEEKSVSPTTAEQEITPSANKLISKVTVAAIQTEEKICTPSVSAQEITPTYNKFLSKVTVSATPTEEKTVTANGEVTPSYGKFISKVTVNVQPSLQQKAVTPTDETQEIIPDGGYDGLSKVTVEPIPTPSGNVLSDYAVAPLRLPSMTSASSTQYCGRLSSGNKHDNIYLSSGIDINDVVVYLAPIGTIVTANFSLLDPATKQIASTVIKLKAGQSVTSTGTTYSPAGIFEFTSAGHITFTHTAEFTVLRSSYSGCPMVLYFNSQYYVPLIDCTQWQHGYVGAGSYASSGTTLYCTNGGDATREYYSPSYYSYTNPKTRISNLANIYWTWYWNSTSSWEKVRMSWNYGLGISVIVNGASSSGLSITNKKAGGTLSTEAAPGATASYQYEFDGTPTSVTVNGYSSSTGVTISLVDGGDDSSTLTVTVDGLVTLRNGTNQNMGSMEHLTANITFSDG